MLADDSSDFVLVMEEMDASGAVDQRDGATWDQALQSVRAMATFHAGWHEHDDLDELSQTFLPIDTELYKQTLPGLFDGGWPGAQHHAGDLLNDELVEFGNSWSARVVKWMDHMSTPRTLCHGDWRLDNVFYDDEGPKVLDFQITGVGNGVFDLGYFVSQSIAPEVRSGRESELVECYIDTLAGHGIDRSFEEVFFDFKVAIAQCFVYGVALFPSYDEVPERSQELMRVLLGRSARAIEDLGVPEAVATLD